MTQHDPIAMEMLQDMNKILSEPLVINVKCEQQGCEALLSVSVPGSLESAAPPSLVVRCAACSNLLRVDLPSNIYANHKMAQLNMLKKKQEEYAGSKQEPVVRTPECQPGVGIHSET